MAGRHGSTDEESDEWREKITQRRRGRGGSAERKAELPERTQRAQRKMREEFTAELAEKPQS